MKFELTPKTIAFWIQKCGQLQSRTEDYGLREKSAFNKLISSKTIPYPADLKVLNDPRFAHIIQAFLNSYPTSRKNLVFSLPNKYPGLTNALIFEFLFCLINATSQFYLCPEKQVFFRQRGKTKFFSDRNAGQRFRNRYRYEIQKELRSELPFDLMFEFKDGQLNILDRKSLASTYSTTAILNFFPFKFHVWLNRVNVQYVNSFND